MPSKCRASHAPVAEVHHIEAPIDIHAHGLLPRPRRALELGDLGVLALQRRFALLKLRSQPIGAALGLCVAAIGQGLAPQHQQPRAQGHGTNDSERSLDLVHGGERVGSRAKSVQQLAESDRAKDWLMIK